MLCHDNINDCLCKRHCAEHLTCHWLLSRLSVHEVFIGVVKHFSEPHVVAADTCGIVLPALIEQC